MIKKDVSYLLFIIIIAGQISLNVFSTAPNTDVVIDYSEFSAIDNECYFPILIERKLENAQAILRANSDTEEAEPLRTKIVTQRTSADNQCQQLLVTIIKKNNYEKRLETLLKEQKSRFGLQ